MTFLLFFIADGKKEAFFDGRAVRKWLPLQATDEERKGCYYETLPGEDACAGDGRKTAQHDVRQQHGLPVINCVYSACGAAPKPQEVVAIPSTKPPKEEVPDGDYVVITHRKLGLPGVTYYDKGGSQAADVAVTAGTYDGSDHPWVSKAQFVFIPESSKLCLEMHLDYVAEGTNTVQKRNTKVCFFKNTEFELQHLGNYSNHDVKMIRIYPEPQGAERVRWCDDNGDGQHAWPDRHWDEQYWWNNRYFGIEYRARVMKMCGNNDVIVFDIAGNRPRVVHEGTYDATNEAWVSVVYYMYIPGGSKGLKIDLTYSVTGTSPEQTSTVTAMDKMASYKDFGLSMPSTESRPPFSKILRFRVYR